MVGHPLYVRPWWRLLTRAVTQEHRTLLNAAVNPGCPVGWTADCCANPCSSRAVRALSFVAPKYTRVGFTTLGHTGEDISVYSSGSIASKLKANMNNVDIGQAVFSHLSLDVRLRGVGSSDFTRTFG